MRHTARNIYTRDHINKTAEWQKANGKRNQHAYLQAIVKWMSFVAHTHMNTQTYAREFKHWIGLLPTVALLPVHVSVWNSFLVIICLWRLLLACFHFSSSLFNGSSAFFFSFYNVAVSLFLFVSIFISFSLFVCCLRWAVQFFVELLLYILWHFLHHFVCIACFGVAAAFVVPLVNPFIDSFNFVLQAYFRCRSISSQLMLYSQPNDASVCRCINYFSL